MVSKRLVREIERNADKLAIDLVEALRHDDRASAYADLTDHEYRGVVRDLYANLGEWLHTRAWNKMRQTYESKGRKRFNSGMPLEQLVYSLTRTKQMLLDFVRRSLPGEGTELALEMELVLAVSDFFDRAIYHTICGYEDARRSREKAQAEKGKPSEAHPRARAVGRAYRVSEEKMPSADELQVSRAGDIGETGG